MCERSTLSIQRTKRGSRRAWVLALILSAVLGGAAPARAENPVIEGSGMVFDLLFLRPLGVGRIVFGVASFVPAPIFAEVPPGLRG